MTISCTFSLALCLSLALPACAMEPDGDAPQPDESLGEVTSDITIVPGGWETSTYFTGNTYRGGQVTYLDGINYVVRVGSCGSVLCGTGEDAHQLTWSTVSSTGAVTDNGNITAPGGVWQGADSKVSLAAFNGYVYMLHTGADSSSDTYLSRLNPATQSWTQRKIPFTSFGGPPAIAAYNGKLYLVGITSSHSIWYATMDTGENFTPLVTIGGYSSASRVSATVAFGKLWITHRQGTTHDIVYSTFDGTTWSATTDIFGGDNNGVLQGDEPVIGFDGSFIRLVHQRPGSGYLWNIVYNGCKWSTAETSIGTRSSSLPPSLSQSTKGLAMITESDNPNSLFGYAYWASLAFYDRPSPILNCNVTLPGGPLL